MSWAPECQDLPGLDIVPWSCRQLTGLEGLGWIGSQSSALLAPSLPRVGGRSGLSGHSTVLLKERKRTLSRYSLSLSWFNVSRSCTCLFLALIDVCSASHSKCLTSLSAWWFQDCLSFPHYLWTHASHPLWLHSPLNLFPLFSPYSPLFLLFFTTALHGCFFLNFFFTLAVTHLRVTSKGESLPNLDCLLTLTMPQIPANEPVRLAPVPAWRKVKSGAAFAPLPIETNS